MAEDVMTPDLIAFVRQQKDRQEIFDALLRYTRGVDRADKELMKSAYHPDGFDEHGVADGDPEKFCSWAIGWHGEHQRSHQHIITNHTVELDGDTAHGETYFIFWGDNREGPPTLAFGRYIDRFEKRDGKWGVAHRICATEYVGTFNEIDVPEDWRQKLRSVGPVSRDKDDVSYRRPLLRKLG
jgi:ketosteroid isomerase-like protein